MGGVLGGNPVAIGWQPQKFALSKRRILIEKNTHATDSQAATSCLSPLERIMQSDRSRLSELEVRVAHPQHWSAGEHRMNIENLRQLRYRLDDQLKRLRQSSR